MMHGHEKSDLAIVATKPANKANLATVEPSAGAHAAESVEQRAGTKGNADQQSTCRTQCRTNVSQALERIRKVASERKTEKFTALFHHINTELLEEAFYELAQNAARGYFNYHAVPTNGRALEVFRHHVTDLWRRTLRRRSQKDRITWTRMTHLVNAWLPKPNILHPWPSDRFAVTHPRWEPYAGKPPVRFVRGRAVKRASLPLRPVNDLWHVRGAPNMLANGG